MLCHTDRRVVLAPHAETHISVRRGWTSDRVGNFVAGR